MGMIIVTVITIAISTVIILGAYKFLSARATSTIGSKRQMLADEIETTDKTQEDLLKYKDSFCSKGQYESVTSQLQALKNDLENEKNTLKEIEEKLDTAQTKVEEKEAHQQELKSSKEEDEEKLEELLEGYGDISAESISLEQKLADSMKNLDNIQSEVSFSEEQQSVVDNLSSTLISAGENLRNLLMEYETSNERLKVLVEQHEDLEDEYTKLVEQQLGE